MKKVGMMMDGGTATFDTEGGMEAAASKVMKAMEEEGGEVSMENENFILLDSSYKWMTRYIRATIQKAAIEGRQDAYCVSFKEASNSTALRHYSLLLGTLALLVILVRLIGNWWGLIPAAVIICCYVFLTYSPDKGNIARMKRIINKLNK